MNTPRTHFQAILPVLASLLLALCSPAARADAVDDATTGIKAMQRGDAEEAIRWFTKSLATNELPPADRAMVLVMRGNTWYRGGSIDKAIADFSDAIKANPQMGDAYNNRANAWYRKGDYDRAMADFDEAIRYKPSAAAYRNRGDTWQQKKDYDRAIADYDRALRLDPNDSTTKENREGAVSRRAAAGSAVAANASGNTGNTNCKANEELAAKLKAMGATNIQIEGCADARPGQQAQAAQVQPAAQSGGLQLPPPDMSKPMPFAESPGYYTNGITAQAIGDFVKSAQAFHAGALLGDPGCAFNLAVQYEYGQGVPKDRRLANAWLEKSVEDQRMLEQRALRYNFGGFLDLAKRGYAPAQWAAGVAYAEGNDGQKPTGSMEQARLWLNKAAAQGYARASTTLADIDRPPSNPGTSVSVNARYEEPEYMKRAAAARKAQNAANCERYSKGARVFCDTSMR